MNGNLNLCEILKDCPKGTKLYSTIYGYVEFDCIKENLDHPVVIRNPLHDCCETLTSDGREYKTYEGECTLFPSREQRDWNKFTAPWYKKEKFDPKTLKPFDRVLVKNGAFPWRCDIFSYYRKNKRKTCYCVSDNYIYDKCIPYNEETKHLVGTCEDAPELYRYWED